MIRAKNTKDQSANVKVKHLLLDKNSAYLNSYAAMVTSAATVRGGDGALTTTSTTASSSSAAAAASTGATAGKEDSTTDAGAEEEGAAEHKSSGTTTTIATGTGDTPAPAPPLTLEAQAAGGSQGMRDENGAYTAGRAQGELLGVIHSAVISHLTIKIHTEAGDYLCLTVSYISVRCAVC